MSFLRRRIFGSAAGVNITANSSSSSSPEQSRTPSPAAPTDRHGRKLDPVPVPAAKLEKMNKHLKKGNNGKPKGGKRRNIWVFVLGGLFGVVVAGMFAQRNDMIDMAWMEGVNLDTFKDVLPASLINDIKDYQVSGGGPT